MSRSEQDSTPASVGHVALNREAWDRYAAQYEAPGRRSWSTNEVTWGVFGAPEAEWNILPDVTGLDVIELGCGTGYVSAWLKRRGARPVGIDNSPEQLKSARRFQAEFDLDFPLILADAEAVPPPDATFDLAISEYGASIWCDPYRWIPEVARLLRPDGRLIFLVNGVISVLCTPDAPDAPAGLTLLRDYFGMHRLEWSDDTAIEFHLTHGDCVSLLTKSGFELERLVEIRAAVDATTRYPYVTAEWARRWPAEEIWVARRCRVD
jgi:SAM-dependent methyltransferase